MTTAVRAGTDSIRALSAPKQTQERRVLQRKCACGRETKSGGECDECRKRREGKLQRSALRDRPIAEVPSVVHEVLAEPGQPLDSATRTFMESRFGRDFSAVRVHTGPKAARSAESIDAHAYTVGSSIAFGEGKFSPHSASGKTLIAHELAHVVQQSNATSTGPLSIAPASDALEEQANLAAHAVTRDVALPPIPRSARTVRRQPKSGTPEDAVMMGGFFMITFMTSPTPQEVLNQLVIGGHVHPDTAKEGRLQRHGTEWSLVHPVGGEVATFSIEPSVISGRYTARGSYIAFAPHAKKQSKSGIPSVGGGASKPSSEKKSTTSTVGDTKPTSTTDDAALRAEFAKLPDAIKALLGGGTQPAQDLAHVLRIANKLKTLAPRELELFKILPKQLTTDLDAFEQSVDHFIKFKDKILAQAEAEKAKAAKTKEPTLEEKLADTWKGFDESKFGSMSQSEKEATARSIAAQQRNETLKHMATHPGETAYQMAEGVVRVDKTAKAIAEDVREAADGNASGVARLAGGVGALGKTIAAVAAIVFIVLLFVPGVNLVELAVAGLVVALATIALASMEAELRIQAAAESKTVKEFETQTEKSAQAQVTAISTAALIGVALLMKIIARIPLPGRLQNVGNALRMAKTALIEKSGAGPVLRQVKATLLERLRGSKEGLTEAVAAEAKNMQATANVLRGITGEEMLKRIAAGDAALSDLGVPPEQAKALLEVAKKPGQAGLPEQLRQNFLKALEDAPAEATKRVQQFMKDVDQSVADLEKANTETEVKSAIDKAEEKLGPEAQAKQAAKALTGAQQEAELTGKSFKELEQIAREKKYTPEGVQAAETLFYKIKGRLMAALRALRKSIGPKSTSGGTVAVGMTDIEGIAGIEEGRSPKIGGERGGPYETDQPFPSAKGHAERGVLTKLGERIRKALADGTIKREQLKGRTVLIMVDQPVCSSCLSGATGAEVQYLGPLSKFMAEFPELAIEIEEVDTGRHYTTSLPAKK